MKRLMNIICNFTYVFIQTPFYAVKTTLEGMYHEGVLFTTLRGDFYIQDAIDDAMDNLSEEDLRVFERLKKELEKGN